MYTPWCWGRASVYMAISPQRIQRNLECVRRRIDRAAARAGRNPASVRLVAVTKAVGEEEVAVLKSLGVREFGENRVREAAGKIANFQTDCTWHMIGTIQSRKVRDVVRLFHWVDSVDRVELAEELDRRCAVAGRTMPILLEVNTTGEQTKHGFAPEQVPGVLAEVLQLESLQIMGLMTMAPLVADPEEARPAFALLRKLAEESRLKELSMGMSNDFEVAVEEGATQVRIGTALFE